MKWFFFIAVLAFSLPAQTTLPPTDPAPIKLAEPDQYSSFFRQLFVHLSTEVHRLTDASSPDAPAPEKPTAAQLIGLTPSEVQAVFAIARHFLDIVAPFEKEESALTFEIRLQDLSGPRTPELERQIKDLAYRRNRVVSDQVDACQRSLSKESFGRLNDFVANRADLLTQARTVERKE